MSKLRVIHNNLADTATITANSTTGSYSASNMQKDTKSSWHRSTGRTVTYTLTWATAQTISAVVLPCTNLSKTATILVKFYSGTGSPVVYTQLNTGATAITACQDTPIQSWSTPTGNQFIYGAVSKTAWWLASPYTNVRQIIIELTDTSDNTAGYIDCARIVCGTYWQPKYTVDRNSLNITSTDTTDNIRTDAGSLIADQGTVYDELQFSLGILEDSDRNELVKILQYSGTSRYLLFSVFPAENNSRTEQLYTVYGKRTNSGIQYVLAGFTSHQVQVLGW